MMAEGEDDTFAASPDAAAPVSADIEVTERADNEHKAKTTLPKIAGSYKLPPSSLLHRPDEQQSVDEDELKLTAQVLTAKYAEFEVHGQVTQINPGPGGYDIRVQA
jgi:S-DNA-T family DNA segregation ATPase FtsK/SpoIIIE